MKIGSLFDGSGGFPLAGAMCGFTPMWASEIEPYPIAVTKTRFSNMKHLGDISKINGATIDPVDIITFGSPCQDMSVAGKRAGLKHEDNGDDETTRSGLFMEAVRIIKEMRGATNGKYPRFAVWENVPGAFSSNKGEDFRLVLEELIKITEPNAVMPKVPTKGWAYADSFSGDGWSLAYRVLDAQYWGVPQRRRRIYLVADFRGECAWKILFERDGLRGNFTQSRTERKGITTEAEGSIGADDREGACLSFHLTQDPITSEKCAPCISSGNPISGQASVGVVVGVDVYNQSLTGDKAKTLNSADTDSDHIPCVVENCAGFCTEHSANSRGIGYEEDVSPTLRAGVTPACVYSIENHPNDSRANLDDSGKVQTLTSRMGTGGGNVPMVMESKEIICMATQQGGAEICKNLCPTITAAAGMSGNNQPVICLQGNGIDRADTAGCNGKGWREDECYTLNTIDRPAVVYAIDREAYNCGENFARTPGIYDDGVNPTIVARGPSAVCYWDGSQTTGTLTAQNADGSQRMPDKENFNCVVHTKPRYIVRRLTPTECARLQGFPDRWGDVEPKTEFTDEEYRFWLDVRNTHAEINNKKIKDYTKKQMLAWYNKLHSDSAEYKLWGSGIALPCALYVMQGIEETLKEGENNYGTRSNSRNVRRRKDFCTRKSRLCGHTRQRKLSVLYAPCTVDDL